MFAIKGNGRRGLVRLCLAGLESFWCWWLQRTTPPEPATDATLSQRELVRRTQFISKTILLSLFVLLAVLVGVILEGSAAAVIIILIALLIQGVAALLNRRAKVNWAGFIIVAWFLLGLTLFLFSSPGSLSTANLPDFYLLIEVELFAVSLLPAWSVFVVMFYNSLLIIADLLLRPHSADLNYLLATTGYYKVVFQPIVLQIVVAIIAYLWVCNTLHALARADRAEEIVQLQQALVQQNQQRLAALEAEKQIALAYEQQRQVNQLKDQFMLHINHELRTPLTAVQGCVELLSMYNDRLTEEKRTLYCQTALASCEELSLLIDNVLDVTQLDQQDNLPRCTVLALAKVARDVIAHLDPRAVQDHQFLVEIPEELSVWADLQFLRQVLRNLLANACKYTPARTSVTITATLYCDELQAPEAPPQICISVQDRGPGIPLAEQPLLFDKFVRLQRDHSGSIRGSGLGLFICRQLVEAMGGRIWVESTGVADAGSRFSFTLPHTAPAASLTLQNEQVLDSLL